MSSSGIISPRTFSTMRVVWGIATKGFSDDYDFISNLIKKYGCPVSKVSDGIDDEDNFYTAIYFDIPIALKDRFLEEEKNHKYISVE
jgi:hypothetical protein